MKETYDLTALRKKVKKALDKPRFEHTKGVMYTAGCMAMAHGADMEKAMTAGLLHDCAKCIPNDEKIRICEENQILINKAEYENPGLLHAKLGAYFAEIKYEIHDPEILHAIKVHTTGEPAMSLMDKIIYIADYIEPGRTEAPRLDYIRQLAFKNLDECMAEILEDTLSYLKHRKASIDTVTELTYNYYRQYLKEEES